MAPKVFKRAARKIKQVLGGGSGSSSTPKPTKQSSDPLNLDEVSRDVYGEEEIEKMQTSPQREEPQQEEPQADPKGKGLMVEESEEEEEESGSEGEEEEEEEEENGSEEESGSESGSEYEEEVLRAATGVDSSEEEEEEGDDMHVDPDVVDTTTRAARKSRTVAEELAGNEPRFHEAEAKRRYETLRTKKIENSRCLDPRVLKQLGIEDDFYKLTDRAGITRAFWEIVEPSYTRLVVEFLCTLKMVYIKNPGEWKMIWKFHGIQYEKTEGEIADYFGLRRGGIDERDEDKHFWERITGLKAPREKKSLDIQMPVIRFIQRALSLSIFARGEHGAKVNVGECSILCHMLRDDNTKHQNVAWRMMKNWLDVANIKAKGVGQITIGGYITHLAKQVGVTNFRMKQSAGPEHLNLDLLASMGHVKKTPQGPKYVVGTHRLDLPINFRLDRSRPATWLLVRNGRLVLAAPSLPALPSSSGPQETPAGRSSSPLPHDTPAGRTSLLGSHEDPAARQFQTEAAAEAPTWGQFGGTATPEVPQFYAGGSSQPGMSYGYGPEAYDPMAHYRMICNVHGYQRKLHHDVTELLDGYSNLEQRMRLVERRQAEELKEARAFREYQRSWYEREDEKNKTRDALFDHWAQQLFGPPPPPPADQMPFYPPPPKDEPLQQPPPDN